MVGPLRAVVGVRGWGGGGVWVFIFLPSPPPPPRIIFPFVIQMTREGPAQSRSPPPPFSSSKGERRRDKVINPNY